MKFQVSKIFILGFLKAPFSGLILVDTTLLYLIKSLVVEVKEAGCENKTQTFVNTLRTGNLILSAFSWGLIGLIVDLGSGASYKPEHKKKHCC